MATRKRVLLKPKSLSSQNGSSHGKSRSSNTINSSDFTVYVRISILILVVLAVGGFLLYPDILNIMKVLQEGSSNNVDVTSDNAQQTPADKQLINTKYSAEKEEDIQANSPSDSVEVNQPLQDHDKKEDLMEDEEVLKNGEDRNKATRESTASRLNKNEPSDQQNKAAKENKASNENKAVNENKASNENKAAKEKAANENTASRLNKREPSDQQNKAANENKASNENKAAKEKAANENTASRLNKREPSDQQNKAANDNKAANENKGDRPNNKEYSDEQNKAATENTADRQSKIKKSPSVKEQNRERTDTINGKQPSTDTNIKRERTIKSQKENIDKKTAPIILSGKNNQIVLDPSQIKIVDSGDSVKTKHDKEKQSAGASKTQNVEKKKLNLNTEAKVKGTSTGGENLNVLEEAKNFNATFQKTFTPKKIFADGRRIPPIELLHQKSSNSSVRATLILGNDNLIRTGQLSREHVTRMTTGKCRVFLFDDFLSQQECDGLIRAHDSHVKALNKPPILCFDSIITLRKHIKDVKKNINVTPRDFTKGTRCVNASFSLQLQDWMQSNWSYSTAFYPGESPFSKVVASRIKDAMGLDPATGGKFQITSYPEGKAYKEHTDCTLGGTDLRDRVVSVMMYLSNVDEGGETTFPELGIWVKPKKGRALVWNNMSPDGVCEDHSKHVASIVKKGSKYILIRWYYYKTFYALGMRPQAPHLPEREPDQPVVSCDEYSSGSCRWYDEWTYQHMVDYQQNRLQLF